MLIFIIYLFVCELLLLCVCVCDNIYIRRISMMILLMMIMMIMCARLLLFMLLIYNVAVTMSSCQLHRSTSKFLSQPLRITVRIMITTLFILSFLFITKIASLSSNISIHDYAIVTAIRYCELHDAQVLEAKRRIESARRPFYPLLFSQKDFENTYKRNHEWAKIVAIQRVLPEYVNRVLYVDDIKTFDIYSSNGEFFEAPTGFLSRWWNLGETYRNIDEAFLHINEEEDEEEGSMKQLQVIRPYVKRPRDGEEIVIKNGLTIQVSLKHFSPYINRDNHARLCVSIDDDITIACAVAASSSSTVDLQPTRTTYVLHAISHCKECGSDFGLCTSTHNLILNVPDVETRSYPDTNITFTMGKPLSKWGCHHIHGSAYHEKVRNRRNGVMYVVENRTLLPRRRIGRTCVDDSLVRFEDVDFKIDLVDSIRYHCERNQIPQLTAKHLYGVNRTLAFWVETFQEKKWNQLGEIKRVTGLDTVPISRSNVIQVRRRYDDDDENISNNNIVICVLMNRGAESFRRALTSWHESKLLNHVSGIYVFVQELDDDKDKDERLSHDVISSILSKNNAVIIGQREQVGIAEAFAQLMDRVDLDHHDDNPYILFLEEDFCVDSDKVSTLESHLEEALELMKSVDVVRLRSRNNPGIPDCYYVFFSHQIHLLPVFARLSSANWLQNEDVVSRYANIEMCGGNHSSLCAHGRDTEWTNNPFLARLSWIHDVVVPVAKADYATLGPSANLETPFREIPFLWSDREFRVAQTRGIFTHDDVDKPIKDQSWPCGILHMRMNNNNSGDE